MTMTLEQLQSRGFIPRPIAERMGETEAGKLAAFLDQLLYDASRTEITWNCDGAGTAAKQTRFHCPDAIYVHESKDGKAASGKKDVEAVLRSVRDYLEACALKEALENR